MVRSAFVSEASSSTGDDAYDRIVPLTKVRFPGNPHAVTLWRWKSRGVSRGNRRVLLKTVTCGGRVFCCQRWADEFIAACNVDQPFTSEPSDNYPQQAAAENAALKSILQG